MRKRKYRHLKKLIAGDKIGRLTLISSFRGGEGHLYWNCICECGVKTTPRDTTLKYRKALSCGCLRLELLSITHREHGDSNKPEWLAWNSMIERCERKSHPAFKNYGLRGIKVCRRWRRSYPLFLADVGRRPSPSHSLNRIENDGNYEPGNVNWATRTEQARNRRSNRIIEIDGVRKTATEWANHFHINYWTACHRIKYGWSVKEAFTAPLKKNKYV